MHEKGKSPSSCASASRSRIAQSALCAFLQNPESYIIHRSKDLQEHLELELEVKFGLDERCPLQRIPNQKYREFRVSRNSLIRYKFWNVVVVRPRFGIVRASPLGLLFCPGNLVNHTRGKNWAKGRHKRNERYLSRSSIPRDAAAHTLAPFTVLTCAQCTHEQLCPHHLLLCHFLCISSIFFVAFIVNSEPHTGARPSVRLIVGPELSRCVHTPILLKKIERHASHGR